MQALMVIDVQLGLFEGPKPHDGEAVVRRIADLLRRARSAEVPVLFVQHDGGPGDETDKNGPGFAFRAEVAPMPGESVTIKTRCNAFQETDLDLKLRANGINNIVVCGMQTEYCVDTTVRAAFERGYGITVVSDAHTTLDGNVLPAEKIIAQAHHIWDGRFAKLKKAAEIRFG
jgi:nicotinamidase-related amidase